MTEAHSLVFVIFDYLVDIQMDVRDMNGFESGSFDAVIDKGTNSYIVLFIVYVFSLILEPTECLSYVPY